jgi:hypothetical protein
LDHNPRWQTLLENPFGARRGFKRCCRGAASAFLEAEFWMMNRDGTDKRQLTWFHTPDHPHYLHKPFAVAADFDWSPDGTRIAGLVLTNMPDTRKRGSGMNVLIDLPEN